MMTKIKDSLMSILSLPATLSAKLGSLIPLPVLILAVLVAILTVVPMYMLHTTVVEKLDRLSTRVYLLNRPTPPESITPTAVEASAPASPKPSPRTPRPTFLPVNSTDSSQPNK